MQRRESRKNSGLISRCFCRGFPEGRQRPVQHGVAWRQCPTAHAPWSPLWTSAAGRPAPERGLPRILVPVPVPLFVFGFVPVHTASVLTIQFQYSEHGIKQTASVFRAEIFLLPGQFRRLCDVFDGVQDLLLLLIRELIEPGIEHRVGTWPFVQQNVVGAGIQGFAQVDECCNRSAVTPRSRPETYCLVTSGSSDTCSCVMFRLRRHSLIRRPICTLSGFFFLFSRMGFLYDNSKNIARSL